jgi:hypothetical protein
MGKGLLLILVLLVIGVVALGFHQGWFTAFKDGDNKGTEIKVNIDREKVTKDMKAYQKKAEGRLKEFDERIEELKTKGKNADAEAKIKLDQDT